MRLSSRPVRPTFQYKSYNDVLISILCSITCICYCIGAIQALHKQWGVDGLYRSAQISARKVTREWVSVKFAQKNMT